MKVIFILLIIFIILGCSSTKSELIKYDGINNSNSEEQNNVADWDISLNQIESVSIVDLYGNETLLGFEDGYRIIKAFNAVQCHDILKEYEELQYGIYNSGLRVKLMNEDLVEISYEPLGFVRYKGVDYSLRYQIEFFEIMREIDLEYKLGIHDFEKWFTHSFESGYAVAQKNNIILIPEKTINEAMEVINQDYRTKSQITFTDILEEYEGQLGLNDIVKTENLSIQVLEVNEEGNVIAISVEVFSDK